MLHIRKCDELRTGIHGLIKAISNCELNVVGKKRKKLEILKVGKQIKSLPIDIPILRQVQTSFSRFRQVQKSLKRIKALKALGP